MPPESIPNNADTFRILFLGDVVGEPGRKAVLYALKHLKADFSIDFAIVNGENSAGGRGITPKICIGLLRAGAAVVTTGDHVWDQSEIVEYIATEPRLLRPLKLSKGSTWRGLDRAGVGQSEGRCDQRSRPDVHERRVGESFSHDGERSGPAARGDADHICPISMPRPPARRSPWVAIWTGKVSAVIGTHTHVQNRRRADLSRWDGVSL